MASVLPPRSIQHSAYINELIVVDDSDSDFKGFGRENENSGDAYNDVFSGNKYVT